MWWVDLLILVILGLAGYGGWKRGFIFVALDLTGFILALVFAFLSYALVGNWLAQLLKVQPNLAKALAFVVLWVIGEALYGLATKSLATKLPAEKLQSPLNRSGGAVLNLVRMTILVALGLIVFASLPLTAAAKEKITKAYIPRFILASTGQLQHRIQSLLGSSIQDSLGFLTVKPKSDESLDLKFKTTDVFVNESAEQEMLAMLNTERAKRGLVLLVADTTIRAVARKHSTDMFARGYFAHINPDGDDPFDRMKAGGVEYMEAGENLALAPTVAMAHDGLMNSPGHRANILDPDYRRIGIGAVESTKYGIMFTQNFTD